MTQLVAFDVGTNVHCCKMCNDVQCVQSLVTLNMVIKYSLQTTTESNHNKSFAQRKVREILGDFPNSFIFYSCS